MTATTTRRLMWAVTGETADDPRITGTVWAGFTPSGTYPNAGTVWHDTAWIGQPTQTATGWERRVSLLVAGPDGPTQGEPVVLAPGTWTPWVRVEAGVERWEFGQPGLLVMEE